MIRFERRNTNKAQIAIKSLADAKAHRKSYNTPEVNDALYELFCGKCYICEAKKVTSFQIEHLHPHKSDDDLKYDWNNLFLSCAHCNNIKNSVYDPILDCTKVDIDKKIAFRKEGYFGNDEKYIFVPIEKDKKSLNTVALLEAAYYGTTSQKKIEAKNIRRSLRNELSLFKNLVREYEEADGTDKEDYLYAIKKEVSQRSEFTAFKRWILWDNKERFEELIALCDL